MTTQTTRPPFPIWKTIQLGTLTVKAIREDLLVEGFEVGDRTNYILDKISVAKLPTKVDLVVLSVAELGFPNGAAYDDICVKAKELGFELCSAEVGPQLRLQYTDQPKDECIGVAMKTIRGWDDYMYNFSVDHHLGYGPMKLNIDVPGHGPTDPGECWGATDRFVFIASK